MERQFVEVIAFSVYMPQILKDRHSYSLSNGPVLGNGRPAYDSVTAGNDLVTVAESAAYGQRDIPATVTLSLLKKGAVSNAVKKAQAILIQHGYSCGGLAVAGHESPDGEFGPTKEKAVKDFQILRKLEDDGEIGKDTWTVLLTA